MKFVAATSSTAILVTGARLEVSSNVRLLPSLVDLDRRLDERAVEPLTFDVQHDRRAAPLLDIPPTVVYVKRGDWHSIY
jgi:hypothetical protein